MAAGAVGRGRGRLTACVPPPCQPARSPQLADLGCDLGLALVGVTGSAHMLHTVMAFTPLRTARPVLWACCTCGMLGLMLWFRGVAWLALAWRGLSIPLSSCSPQFPSFPVLAQSTSLGRVERSNNACVPKVNTARMFNTAIVHHSPCGRPGVGARAARWCRCGVHRCALHTWQGCSLYCATPLQSCRSSDRAAPA